jgi:predicted RNase H-like HicB family nuclease
MPYDAMGDSLNGDMELRLQIELDRQEDGRWIAEIASLPGVMAYGKTKPEAVARVKALALRVLADQVEKEKQSKSLDVSIACCR